MLTKELITSISEESREPAWLQGERLKAWQRYERLPVPSFKYGLNIFFVPSTIGLPDESLLTRVEQATPQVSIADGVTVIPFDEAARDDRFEAILKQYFSSRTSEDKIFSLHDAMRENGLLVFVEENAAPAKPVRIDVCLREEMRADHVLIVAGCGSVVTVVEHLFSDINSAKKNGRHFRTSTTDIVAKEGSRVTHIAVQNFGDNVTDFTRKRALAAAGATVNWIECSFGGSYAQSSILTRLEAPGAAVKSRSIFFGDNRRQFDLYNEVVHAAPRTSSDIAARGALSDKAKTVYRGLIRMEKNAAGSDGKQSERTLMLSEDAEIDAVPNLEINVDDVRCSHSAAAGRIDAEQLFYLMSRGLDEKTALRTLVNSFFVPVLRDMAASGLEEVASCIIAERLQKS